MKLKLKQKINYDRVTRRLEPLREGDVVRIEGPDAWTRKATVLSEVVPEWTSAWRNRKSLLKTQENIEEVGQETESEKGVEETPDLQHSEPPSPSAVTEAPDLRKSTRHRKTPDRLIEQ
ncbi:hypothetical protein F7725_015926 [Dissostichus mawsoni]|uniref:Uncharacterized protein n=1 Tax=Dissostichus mawsoni TaxID=36200 RepID=A0A7J5YL12_DISMA|nr:hypothetical protein F7725_015926 [Dissostichus mawsoni]